MKNSRTTKMLVDLLASGLLPKASTIAFLCLEQMIATNFSPGEVIVFSMPSNFSDTKLCPVNSAECFSTEISAINNLLSNVNSKTEWLIVISTDYQSGDMTIPELQHGYVLILMPMEDQVESAVTQIDYLQSFSFSYNRRAKFIVVVLQKDVNDTHLLSQQILQKLWDLDKIVNSVVLICECENIVYNIYTLMPYRSDDCGESDEVQLIYQCTAESISAEISLQLPEKLSLDMHGCNLRVNVRVREPYIVPIESKFDGIDDFEGIDLIYLNFIAEAMNISLKLNFAARKYDDTFIHFLNEGGIYIGGAPLTGVMFPFVDLTIPYSSLNYMLFVPCAKRNPISGNVLKVFSVNVWLILIAILLIGAVLLWYLHKSLSFSMCLMNTWAIFLSVSVDCMPIKTEVRVFFLVFLSYCFAISIIFQSFFTSFLIDPGYENQINSFEDLNEKHIPFVYYKGYEELELVSETKILSKMKYKLECVDYEKCLLEVLKYGNGSVMDEKGILEYLSYSNGIYTDHCTILSTFNIGVCIYLQKGDPLTEKFNYFIQKCLEVGLADRYSSLTKINLQSKVYEESSSYSVLGLFHLQTSFSILILGYSFSTSVWLLEFIFSKSHQINM
ncbi:Ionotropic receptor 741 [Blattella germanica]|nr:Ionotropic receptor 741 [Blattella germanica]